MITMLMAAAVSVAAAQIPVGRVADDAKAVGRVAEASKHDLPRDLLKRIVNEDIELLRGRRADGTFQYASFERFESGRVTKSVSVHTADEKFDIQGAFVYRLQIDSPSRRLLVRHNLKVFLDHVDIDSIGIEPGAERKTKTVKIEEWLEPGHSHSVEFDTIAKEATVRLFAHSDTSYGNLDLSLIQARIIDNADSPYADAVSSAKAILRAIDYEDTKSIRAMATRMAGDLDPFVTAEAGIPAAVAPCPTPAPAPATAAAPAVSADSAAPQNVDAGVLSSLITIEDLLTGSEAERRDGMDRLHQLIRKLRPETH